MSVARAVAAPAPRRLKRDVRENRPLRQRVWWYYVVLGALAVFAAGPLLALGFNSVKSDPEIADNPLGFPKEFHWENFVNAWNEGNIARGLINTAVIVVGVVAGVWIVAGPAAYGLARLNLPRNGAIVFYLFLMTALPVQMFLVPLFYIWSRVGLYDTLHGLIIIHVALIAPFATLLLRSYLISLPVEFEEAARLDGASEPSILRRVILPLAWPGFLTIGLVAALGAYNDLFFATLFIQTDSLMPLSTTYLGFQTGFTRQWSLTSAAGVIITIPMLLLFMAMQRRFVEGLTSGGLKG